MIHVLIKLTNVLFKCVLEEEVSNCSKFPEIEHFKVVLYRKQKINVGRTMRGTW